MMQCGNCSTLGWHRAERCPEVCFACGADHCYLDCPSNEAKLRAAQNRARWRGGNVRGRDPLPKNLGKGTAWMRHDYGPTPEPPSPDKAARPKKQKEWERTEMSLAELIMSANPAIADTLVARCMLIKPCARPHCTCEPTAKESAGESGTMDVWWECDRACRRIRHIVFKNFPFELKRVRTPVWEYGALGWCFSFARI